MILSMEYTPEVSGGLGTHVLEISNGLSRMGSQVVVIARSPQAEKTIKEGNLVVYLLKHEGGSDAKQTTTSLAGSILAFNNDLMNKAQEVIGGAGWEPDIIQCYNWLTFPAAQQIGRAFGIPVISVVQYISEPIERWWGQKPDQEIISQEKLLFRCAKKFITVSNSMRAIIKSEYSVRDEQISVVYNGMDPQPFIKPALKLELVRRLRRTVAKSGEKIVFFAGRLHPHKGIAALLESASFVVEQFPNVHYVMAGEPDSREFAQYLEQLINRYPGLLHNVTWLGKIPRDDLATLYHIADLAVVPSVYEPFGYAAIEAMASGTPVIATNVGGLSEIVLHNKTGLLSPVQRKEAEPHSIDIGALVSAQLSLLKDEALARKLGLAGRRRVQDYFSAERMTSETIKVYRQAISDHFYEAY
jgi:glycosyltransferase involved in cell wall biosynthesis